MWPRRTARGARGAVALRSVCAVALSGVLALTISACGGEASKGAGGQGGAKGDGVLVIGQDREPVGFDPVTSPAWASQNVYEHVYEPLLRFDDKGLLTAGLVESWDRPDDLTVTLKLREGVKFHDGTDMTAADVVYSIDRFRSPDSGSLHSTLYSSIKSVTAVDDFNVKIELSSPDVGLLNAFASPYQMVVFPARAATPRSRRSEPDRSPSSSTSAAPRRC